MIDQLVELGFIQGFPFVDCFRKSLSETHQIIVETCFNINKNKTEDMQIGSLGIKITEINLPNKEQKIYSQSKNAINFIHKLLKNDNPTIQGI